MQLNWQDSNVTRSVNARTTGEKAGTYTINPAHDGYYCSWKRKGGFPRFIYTAHFMDWIHPSLEDAQQSAQDHQDGKEVCIQ